MVASSKLKEAVGMKTGRHMPDVLVVDAMEGITGDSYVTGGRGTRQIKGVYHGIILIGGSGARQYLWNDKLVRLLITDRYKSGFVLGSFGSATPTITNAGLAENVEIAAEDNKKTRKELEKSKAVISSHAFVNDARILTARSAENVNDFLDAFIEEVGKTAQK